MTDCSAKFKYKDIQKNYGEDSAWRLIMENEHDIKELFNVEQSQTGGDDILFVRRTENFPSTVSSEMKSYIEFKERVGDGYIAPSIPQKCSVGDFGVAEEEREEFLKLDVGKGKKNVKNQGELVSGVALRSVISIPENGCIEIVSDKGFDIIHTEKGMILWGKS